MAYMKDSTGKRLDSFEVMDVAKKKRGLLPPDPGLARLLPIPTVMASPPAVTMGAANAGTTIAGSVAEGADKPLITYLGAAVAPTANNGGYSQARASTALTSSQTAEGRMRFEFETDADQFEVFLNARSNTILYRVWVDGQPATAGPVSATVSGGANYRLKVVLGSRAHRRIIIEGGYWNLISVDRPATSLIWPSTRPLGPKVVWIGDSFSEGSGGDWWWSSWAMKAGQRLGWNVYPSAVGSTGYLATGGGGGKVKYRDRIATDVTPLNPEVIVITGGYNDTGGFTAAQEGAEAALLYAALKAANPNATLIVCSIQSPVGVTSAGTLTQFRDAQKTAALAAGAIFIDTVNYPAVGMYSWITGSGRISAPVGNGNADFYNSADGVHPSQAGHDYMGQRFASALAAQL